MALSLAQITGAKRKTITVETPIGEVFIRELSVRELREWLAGKDTEEKARLVAASLCDENGVAIADASQVGAIGDTPDSVVQPIYLAALRLNGLLKEEKPEDPKGD